MNLALKVLTLFLSLLFFVSCQSGHCRKVDESLPSVVTPEQMDKKDNHQSKKQARRIFVYKYDGSLQCDQGRKIPLKEMAGQLDGIKVYSMQNKNDGLMHIQVCGSATGFANVYEIAESDKLAAQKAGFKVWEFEH
jgi:hypothetical protein